MNKIHRWMFWCFRYYFYLPMLILLLINLMLYIAIICRLWKTKRATRKAVGSRVREFYGVTMRCVYKLRSIYLLCLFKLKWNFIILLLFSDFISGNDVYENRACRYAAQGIIWKYIDITTYMDTQILIYCFFRFQKPRMRSNWTLNKY